MIKPSFRLILAALAATMALASCTKEITPAQTDQTPVSPQDEGSRVIAVSFGPRTKTALADDGLQPVFMDGDEILVSNGQDEPEIRVVSVKDKIATISTNLTGPLKAVYPANAANLDGNEIKGVSVSPTQTGTFADANICMAEGITGRRSAASGSTPLNTESTDEASDLKKICRITNYSYFCTELACPIKWTGVSPVGKGLKRNLNSFFVYSPLSGFGITFKPSFFPSLS